MTKIRKEEEKGAQSIFHISTDGMLQFPDRICIPNDAKLKRVILLEAHQSLYIVHSGSTKMTKKLLVEQEEEGYSAIRGAMSYTSTSQG